MPASKEFYDKIVTLLTPIGGISGKPMFGGYGIFHEGAMFALISQSELYFKVDDLNRAAYVGARQFRPMPYFEIPEAIISDSPKLLKRAADAIKVAHSPPAKKKK
jgi:DNA transformation protein and related proteins